jgi:hypothetical protein
MKGKRVRGRDRCTDEIRGDERGIWVKSTRIDTSSAETATVC